MHDMKKRLTDLQKRLLIIAAIVQLPLLIIFSQPGWREGVYLHGFPMTFLTFYSRDFFINIGGDIPVLWFLHFLFNPLALAINIALIWVILLLLYRPLRTLLSLVRRQEAAEKPEKV